MTNWIDICYPPQRLLDDPENFLAGSRYFQLLPGAHPTPLPLRSGQAFRVGLTESSAPKGGLRSAWANQWNPIPLAIATDLRVNIWHKLTQLEWSPNFGRRLRGRETLLENGLEDVKPWTASVLLSWQRGGQSCENRGKWSWSIKSGHT